MMLCQQRKYFHTWEDDYTNNKNTSHAHNHIKMAAGCVSNIKQVVVVTLSTSSRAFPSCEVVAGG